MVKNIKSGNWLIAILLACITAVILTSTAPTIGLTWDEPMYITGADSYAAWFDVLAGNPKQAVKAETIDKYWTFNHEHPPLEKIWSGLVAKAARHFFDELTANRLGVILMVSLLIAMLYLIVAQTYGKAAGFFAAAALLSMPRFFFHAHLAALDMPVAVASFGLAFIFWKTIDRKGWAWGILCGVVLGLAAATKLNGVFILIALILWSLFFRRKWSVVLRFLLTGFTSVLIFFLIWPWLYHQTWVRIMEYVNFHLHHFAVGQWYLGHFYMTPPWHFTFVILWAVVPLSVMILCLAGMARAGKGKQDGGMAWLLIMCIAVSILPFIIGKSELHDNDRLFIPVFPFIAALAGIGFDWLIKGLEKIFIRIKQPALTITTPIIMGIALLISQSAAMAGLYPHLLSYYSEGVGGLRGANKLGMETTYWCETYSAALPYLNSQAKPGDTIWVEPLSANVLIYYQTIGRLRRDVQIMTPPNTQSVLQPASSEPVSKTPWQADWFIVQYNQSQFVRNGSDMYSLLQTLDSRKPVYQVISQGVPLMRLYGVLK
jgi:4-amino-4-deoxy-L-arabinose transferase-like glycosyltransferase